MSIHVFENEAWRRPVNAAAEETYDLEGAQHGRRDVRWVFHDRYQFEDLKRLAEGMVCSSCLEVFPAKPGADTVTRFREVYGGKPEPIGSRWRQRVMNGCCPICGTEVSTEYFEALYRGTLPPIPDYPED